MSRLMSLRNMQQAFDRLPDGEESPFDTPPLYDGHRPQQPRPERQPLTYIEVDPISGNATLVEVRFLTVDEVHQQLEELRQATLLYRMLATLLGGV